MYGTLIFHGPYCEKCQSNFDPKTEMVVVDPIPIEPKKEFKVGYREHLATTMCPTCKRVQDDVVDGDLITWANEPCQTCQIETLTAERDKLVTTMMHIVNTPCTCKQGWRKVCSRCRLINAAHKHVGANDA